ncbi:hypothetical protein B4110_2667 [Parageobacillus toebii]|uniref:Uncharacterized protein n=1 Tax=Parageobacillus toebii TaxID=153151 RepID=A0A150N8D0_9BACL|nr:hypothetical protein B4110_2667 [Parageobacillus toebii]
MERVQNEGIDGTIGTYTLVYCYISFEKLPYVKIALYIGISFVLPKI